MSLEIALKNEVNKKCHKQNWHKLVFTCIKLERFCWRMQVQLHASNEEDCLWWMGNRNLVMWSLLGVSLPGGVNEQVCVLYINFCKCISIYVNMCFVVCKSIHFFFFYFIIILLPTSDPVHWWVQITRNNLRFAVWTPSSKRRFETSFWTQGNMMWVCFKLCWLLMRFGTSTF